MKTGEIRKLSEVSKKIKPKWIRCYIEQKKLRELSQKNNFQGACQALGHLLAWLLTGSVCYYFFENDLWTGFILSLIIHGTVGTCFMHGCHELSHGTVFKTKYLNGIFLNIFSLLSWFPYHIYKMSHSYHHRFTLYPEGDREQLLPHRTSLHVLYLIQLFTVNITGGVHSVGLIPTIRSNVKIAMNCFEKPFSDWGEELYEGQKEERAKAVNWARSVIIFHSLVIILSVWIGEPILAVLISGHTFFGGWHLYFTTLPQHCGLMSNVNDFRKCARTIKLDPISEFFYWHMNWHLEHHMFAGVPCYNLRKLNKIIYQQLPKPKTLIGAWIEMRKTWKRQQVDPTYEYNTPVPPISKEYSVSKDETLEALSMGDLAPKSILS